MFFFLLLLLLPARLFASYCQPSSNSCDFYLCKEREMQCGEQGYLTRFGYRLCEVYRQKERFSSRELQEWYPKVRLCLQRAVSNLPEVESCSDFGAQAFATHEDCYINTGFCALSWNDKMEVWHLAGAAAYLPSSMEVSLKVLARCGL